MKRTRKHELVDIVLLTLVATILGGHVVAPPRARKPRRRPGLRRHVLHRALRRRDATWR